MSVAVGSQARRGALGAGIAFALVSAATFGSSGAMAKSLIETGWTSGAAVLVRLAGAAVLLSIAAFISARGRLRLRASSLRVLLAYGIIAMAGTQLAFFNAVRTLDVGVALLLEFLAPVLLLIWTSLRTRTLPRRATLLGAALSLVGLVFVLELTTTSGVDPVGVGWGLLAAVGLCGFFVISARQEEDLPPLVMAAGGTAVGAVVIAVAGLIGVVPLGFATEDVVLAETSAPWWVPALWLVVIATVVAYVTGIRAILQLGTRLASFVALTEVLFAVLVAWVVLAQLPGPSQLVGGVCIVVGILIIQRDDTGPAPPPVTVESTHPV